MSVTKSEAIAELKRRGKWIDNEENSKQFNVSREEAINELKKRGKWSDNKEKDESHFVSKEEPVEEENWKRRFANVPKNILGGVASVFDLPTLPARYVLNKGAEMIGSKTRFRPAQQISNEFFDEISGGYTKPRNASEELEQEISQGLVSLPFGSGVGSALKASKILSPKIKGIADKLSKIYEPNVANVGATAGSIAGSDYYRRKNEEQNLLGEFGSGLAGGISGGLAAGATKGAIKGLSSLAKSPKDFVARQTGKLTGFSPEMYETLSRAEIPASLASVSEGVLPSAYENILYHTPGSSKIMEDFYKKRAKALTSKLGFEGKDLNELPELVNKDLAQLGAEKLQRKKSAEYGKLQKVFGPAEIKAKKSRAMVDVSDILEELREKASGLVTPAEKREFLKTVPGKALNELEKVANFSDASTENLIKSLKKANYPEETIKKVIGELPGQKPEISYASLDLLRSKMLKKMESLEPGTLERKEASDIYAALSNKRHEFMESYGTAEQSSAAKKARKLWHEYARPDMEKITGKEKGLKKYVYDLKNSPNEAAAFDKLTGRDPRYLKAVSQGLNKQEKQDLFQSIIVNMGKKDNAFNLSSLYNKFSKKEHPVMEQILNLMPTSKSKQDFVDVMDYLGKNKRIAESVANTSRTAHTAQLVDMMKESLKHTTSLATGAPLAALEGLIGIAFRLKAGEYGARLLTDPIFLDRINRAMKSQNPKIQNNLAQLILKTPSVKNMMRSSAFRNIQRASFEDDEE